MIKLVMQQPDNSRSFNKRRLVVLIVVVFLIVLSFFAGQHYGRHADILPQDPGTTRPGSDRQGIPPDSLPH
jgi:hypothetical protein